MQIFSRPLATGKEFVPIAAKHGPQTRQRWQAGKVVTGFDVLNVAGAHANFFGQFFLSQIPTRSQRGHVLSKPRSMRTGFGFARRHDRILSKRRPNTRLYFVRHSAVVSEGVNPAKSRTRALLKGD